MYDLRKKYNDSVKTAILRYTYGEEPTFSTGICGSVTAGYGKLDENGYWEYPLPNCIVEQLLED